MCQLPHAVAASDGNLHERRFEGGLLRLAESQKDRQQVYVIIELTTLLLIQEHLS